MPVGIHVKVHLPDVKTGDVETMLLHGKGCRATVAKPPDFEFHTVLKLTPAELKPARRPKQGIVASSMQHFAHGRLAMDVQGSFLQ